MSEATPTVATRPSNVKAIVPLGAGAVLQSIPQKADEVTVVRNGRGLMPSFAATLTPQQIDAVVEFTRTGLQTAR